MMRIRFALLPLLLAGPALAAPGGRIGTLQRGYYQCEMPGDATGPAGVRLPDEDFSVINASSYETPAGRGSYLFTGDIATMTSGPKQGQRFKRIGSGFLRKIGAADQLDPLRCIRTGANAR